MTGFANLTATCLKLIVDVFEGAIRRMRTAGLGKPEPMLPWSTMENNPEKASQGGSVAAD